MAKTQGLHTRADRRERVKEYLLAPLKLSDRKIASLCHVSPTTVGKIKSELIQTGHLPIKQRKHSNPYIYFDEYGYKRLDHPWAKANAMLVNSMSPRSIRALLAPGVLDALQERGTTKSPTYMQAILRREEKAKRRKNTSGVIPEVIIKKDNILTGLPWITDEVDVIMTDVPYGRGKKGEYVECCKALSHLAGRCLKKNGLLVVMLGQSAFPEILNALLEDDQIEYYWLLNVVMNRASTHMRFIQAQTKFKPVLLLTKGGYVGEQFSDLIFAEPANKNENREIPWQQPIDVFQKLCDTFIQKGDTVLLDPMCGSGTNLIAGLRTNSCAKVIGVDIDPHRVTLTRKNIEAELNTKEQDGSK